VDLAHQVTRGFDRVARSHECGRVQEELGQLGVHQRTIASCLLIARKLVEFLRDLAIEKCGKTGIGLNQVESDLLGDDVAKGFLARKKSVPALAVNQRTTIEAVLWTKQRQEIGVIPLFYRPLDDNIERLRECVPGYDGLAWAIVCDIERC